MSLLQFTVVPGFSAVLYIFFNVNNIQLFVVAAADIELQWYFALGCNCCG